jgi:hypothetical protein
MSWKFKEPNENTKVYTDDTYYDFFHGGYFNEQDLLEDSDQIEDVRKARLIILDFINSAAEHGILEVI